MTFDAIQATVAARLDADAYFSGKGMAARLGFAARYEGIDALDTQTKADLAGLGVSLVVGLPQIDTMDRAAAGRALMGCKLMVDVVENASRNRGGESGALGVAPETVAAEVFKALIGHVEIDPYPDDCYRTLQDEKAGLDIYRCAFLVRSDLTGR